MSDPLNADEQRLEEIVAYLDGELAPEESARVERRLASDEAYRQQLQGVERAWKALDELPMAMVDDKFARTTMQVTIAEARTELQAKTTALPIVRRRSRLATWLVAAAAAALGFLVVRLAVRHPERMLLADLPVIDNVDVYSQIDRPQYLRLLAAEFGTDLEELGGKPSEAPEGLARLQTVSLVGQRADWLGNLDAAERTNLRAKYNRFRELSDDEQKQLRELHEQIATAPDAPELQRSLFVYDEWLRGLPPARQFELRNMPAEERVRTIRQWVGDMRDDAMFALSEDELRRFFRNMREPLNDLMRSAAREALRTPPEGRRPNRFAEPMTPNLSRALAVHFASGVARPGEFQTALLAALPERTREPFQQLAPREKVERVMAWKRQAELLQGQVSEKELERFFSEELDAETRAELLSLPAGDMQQALRRLYRRQLGGFGGPAAWGQRPGRDPRDGPEGRRGPEGRGGFDGRRPREWDGPPPRPEFGPPPGDGPRRDGRGERERRDGRDGRGGGPPGGPEEFERRPGPPRGDVPPPPRAEGEDFPPR